MFKVQVAVLAIAATVMAHGAKALDLEIIVNESVCDGANVQCSNFAAPIPPPNHTQEPASSTNHNPVAIYVHVTLLNRPLSNLPASAFRFEQKFQPATAPGYTVCNNVVDAEHGGTDAVGCGGGSDALFQNAGGGVYAFYVHPSAVGFNWAAGEYVFVVTVTDPPRGTGRALGSFVIP